MSYQRKGRARPRTPVLLLVWQRLRTLGTFSHNAAHKESSKWSLFQNVTSFTSPLITPNKHSSGHICLNIIMSCAMQIQATRFLLSHGKNVWWVSALPRALLLVTLEVPFFFLVKQTGRNIRNTSALIVLSHNDRGGQKILNIARTLTYPPLGSHNDWTTSTLIH